MYARRNSSVQATFTWTQIPTATLPLFTEVSSAKPISPEAILLWETNTGVSHVLWATSGQLQAWSTEMLDFITRELEGEDGSCKSPPCSTKKSASKQIKPRQVRAHWGTDVCLFPTLRTNCLSGIKRLPCYEGLQNAIKNIQNAFVFNLIS